MMNTCAPLVDVFQELTDVMENQTAGLWITLMRKIVQVSNGILKLYTVNSRHLEDLYL